MDSNRNTNDSAPSPLTSRAGTANSLPGADVPRPRRVWRRRCLSGFLGGGLLYLGVAIYQTCLKPLPAGLSLDGAPALVSAGQVEFLYDVTATTGNQRVSQQMIFDRVLGLIREAQDFVVVDFFLFNPYLGQTGNAHRKLCQEVTGALVEQKRRRPEMCIIVITDPVNETYGGPALQEFQALRTAGIPVVLTDLSQLRDSNPIYSAFWRIGVQWFGRAEGGWWPHPFAQDAGGVGLRSWLALLNFKANHRKLLVADAPSPAGGRELVGLVMSANPHDGSSAHGNVGLLVRGGIWPDLLRGEQAVLAFSGEPIELASRLPAYAKDGMVDPRRAGPGQGLTVKVLTEGKIRRGLLAAIQSTGKADSLDIAMFYLSERNIIQALLDAAERGVSIRLLLDPNRDAFGYQKNGIPNRPVATELIKKRGGKITVRWANTHGEQFHTKLVLVKQPDQTTIFIGSANLTRRNIGDLNLETDVEVAGDPGAPVFQSAAGYFERLWTNQNYEYSVPYETHGESSRLKYWQYRFQEWSGTSSF